MKTKLHTYSFDLENHKDREPYHQLSAMLANTPGRGHRMHSLKMSGEREYSDCEIMLEPECLFENQWNSDIGRVFDWYEEAVFSYGNERPLIKRGHYLDITDEMREIRRNTLKCGYTGDQFPAAKGHIFNETQGALGSPYLKESELYLVRLLPIDQEFKTQRKPLTEAERAHLLPLYLKAQLKANQKLRDKQRQEILADFNTANTNAIMERDGFIWLLDHGIQIQNVIFYNHTRRFNFGWRQPYTGEARTILLEALKKFPFNYDVA